MDDLMSMNEWHRCVAAYAFYEEGYTPSNMMDYFNFANGQEYLDKYARAKGLDLQEIEGRSPPDFDRKYRIGVSNRYYENSKRNKIINCVKAFPHQTKYFIARKCELRVGTVATFLDTMLKEGIVKNVMRKSANGRMAANYYYNRNYVVGE